MVFGFCPAGSTNKAGLTLEGMEVTCGSLHLREKAERMKYVYSVLFAFTLMSGVFGQGKQTYLETNVGLSYTDEVLEVSPGLSFLYGGTNLRL